MKTNEQIKLEVINYLEKTSKHLFNKPSSIRLTSDGIEHSYDKLNLFKVIKVDDVFKYLEDGKIKNINIDDLVNYYKENSKCVIKHRLFLNKGIKSIKNKREYLDIIDESLQSLIK